jgi:hypothetical protein
LRNGKLDLSGSADFGGSGVTRTRSVNVYLTKVVGIGTVGFGAWLGIARTGGVNVYFTKIVGIGTMVIGVCLGITRTRGNVYFTKIVGIGTIVVGVCLGVTRTRGNVYFTKIVGIGVIGFGLWLVATVVSNVDFVGRINAAAIFTFSDVELRFECLVVSRTTIFEAVVVAVVAIKTFGVVKTVGAIKAVGAANRLLVTTERWRLEIYERSWPSSASMDNGWPKKQETMTF